MLWNSSYDTESDTNTHKPKIRHTDRLCSFMLLLVDTAAVLIFIVRGWFLFSSKPGSSGTFCFQQMVLKGYFALAREYEGTGEDQISLFWAPFCSENLLNFIEMLWLNLFQCHPPHRGPTARADWSCFPCPEPGAPSNPMHYSAPRFHCRSGSLLRYKGYSAHIIA